MRVLKFIFFGFIVLVLLAAMIEHGPAEQRQFIKIFNDSIEEFKNANTLKRPSLSGEADKKFKEAFKGGYDFNGWTGTVEVVESINKFHPTQGPSLGGVAFQMRLTGSKIVLGTTGKIDESSNSLIPANSPLVKTLTELKKNDNVKVSGRFISRYKTDDGKPGPVFLDEHLEGAIYFGVTFSNIEKN
jgi:hypothetical protein